MDRQLLERLVGATILVIALVIIAPAILDGRRDTDEAPVASSNATDAAEAVAAAEPKRTHTIRLDEAASRPPVARVRVPESAEPKPEPSPPPAPEPEPAVSPPAQPDPNSKPPVPKPAPVAKVTPPAKEEKKPPVEPVKPAAPATVVTAQAKASGWAVQLGAFSDRSKAAGLAAAVSKRGFDAYLLELNRAGTTLFRVRVGPQKTREQADELAARLAKAGYPGQVTEQSAGPEA